MTLSEIASQVNEKTTYRARIEDGILMVVRPMRDGGEVILGTAREVGEGYCLLEQAKENTTRESQPRKKMPPATPYTRLFHRISSHQREKAIPG